MIPYMIECYDAIIVDKLPFHWCHNCGKWVYFPLLITDQEQESAASMGWIFLPAKVMSPWDVLCVLTIPLLDSVQKFPVIMCGYAVSLTHVASQIYYGPTFCWQEAPRDLWVNGQLWTPSTRSGPVFILENSDDREYRTWWDFCQHNAVTDPLRSFGDKTGADTGIIACFISQTHNDWAAHMSESSHNPLYLGTSSVREISVW